LTYLTLSSPIGKRSAPFAPVQTGVFVASRHPIRFSKGDLLEKAAACDRALTLVSNPEHREALRQLQKLWKALAKERPTVLRAQFADDILRLNELQTAISTAALH